MNAVNMTKDIIHTTPASDIRSSFENLIHDKQRAAANVPESRKLELVRILCAAVIVVGVAAIYLTSVL